MNNALSVAAAHWNKLHKLRWHDRKSRWWLSETIIRNVNRNICGLPLDGIASGDIALLKTRYPRRKFKKAVSVCSDNGTKELELVKAGLVGHFDLFKIWHASIEQSRILAAKAGAAQLMSFHQLAMNMAEPPNIQSYDLVYWNNALHHMLEVYGAIAWSKSQLKIDGVLYINDFIGPNRMKWTPEMLRIASAVRGCLPPRMLRHTLLPWRRLPRYVPAVNFEKMIAIDPTERADSACMLQALKESFEGGIVTPTGGLIYQTALNDVIGNIHEVRDADILSLLLLIDDMAIRPGLSQYCVMIGDNDKTSLSCEKSASPKLS